MNTLYTKQRENIYGTAVQPGSEILLKVKSQICHSPCKSIILKKARRPKQARLSGEFLSLYVEQMKL